MWIRYLSLNLQKTRKWTFIMFYRLLFFSDDRFYKPWCSAVLAHFILEEKLHVFGVLGCILCVVGSTSIVLHAPKEKDIESVKQVWRLATQPGISPVKTSTLQILSRTPWMSWGCCADRDSSGDRFYRVYRRSSHRGWCSYFLLRTTLWNYQYDGLYWDLLSHGFSDGQCTIFEV